jgi:hypothetical protein
MKRVLVVAAVVAIAVVVWFLVGASHHAAAPEAVASSPAAAVALDAAPGRSIDGAAAGGDTPAAGPATPTGRTATGTTTAAGSAAARAPGGATPGPSGSPAAGSADPRPIPRARDRRDDGELTDRTGWNSDTARQLNRAFMPLASECIELAQARTPGLAGLLSYHVTIAPTDDGKAIVSAVTPRADNQIRDPELFECIQQSSFALEGLDAPHDFDVTMPIDAR